MRVLAAVALTALTGLVVAETAAATASVVQNRTAWDEDLPAELAEVRDELKRNHRPDAVQKSLDALVAKDGFPAALAAVLDDLVWMAR
ncbi:hypothetical protein [Nonomuraea sp. NEAU-A123]|uniref:hypothetical protein n=1 Tax=Nonomuraea sp. NEAU-A123 TaxID=2839649 RepID=UPI001BE47D1F|nr:hypothetical protein [Nonomuraea sp. NEAU-A123]MBT2232258.1 hypothetical protein [Nonomuraea sp. NEAU-A123]